MCTEHQEESPLIAIKHLHSKCKALQELALMSCRVCMASLPLCPDHRTAGRRQGTICLAWSFISATKGEMTTVMPGSTSAGSW